MAMDKKILIAKINKHPERYGLYKDLNKKTLEELINILVIEDYSLTGGEIYNESVDPVLNLSEPLVYKKKKTNQKKIISFDNIKKSFGDKVVHNGVTFDIYEGETLAVLGANGAGKTVLMETLVRVQSQNSGTITYDFGGEDPFEEIGMQFQDADSNSSLTPKEMVKFISKMYGYKVDKEQLQEMLKIYGIEEYYDRKIKKLSGGQKQRVNLLLATMHNPRFMILDEFITGLDILSVQEILKYIAFLKEKNNATLVIISHQPEEIKSLADRVVTLKEGVITKELTHEEIDKKYNGDFTKFLLENI